MSASILVFDKDKDETEFGLYNRASILSLDCAESFDAVAESDALCILMHVTPDDWKRLCERISKEQTAFFISSAGFPPTRPEGKHRNCFRVNRRTKGVGAFTRDQFENFIELLKRGDVLQSLRRETIPTALRPFIQFHEPHLARALHILVQGRLAQWALDPGHPLRAQASEVVGFDAVSMRSSGNFDWILVLRKMLESGSPTDSKDKPENDPDFIENALNQIRDELSHKRDSKEPPIKEVEDLLVKWLGTTPASDHAQRIEQDEALFPILRGAFNALENSLGRTKEGAA